HPRELPTASPLSGAGPSAFCGTLRRMTGRRAGSVAVVAVVAAALLVVALAAWASSDGPSGVFTGEGFDPVTTPSAEPSSTVTADDGAPPADEEPPDVELQRQLLLDTASPRNAVVACWHRFEAQAEAGGVGRHPWETSSEYTIRVLDLVDAHQPAVSRLAALYREARFSEHELTEQHRADA